jgi:hypothetical protein
MFIARFYTYYARPNYSVRETPPRYLRIKSFRFERASKQAPLLQHDRKGFYEIKKCI